MITLLRLKGPLFWYLSFTEHLFLYWKIKLRKEKKKRGEKQIDCYSSIIFLEFFIFLLKAEKNRWTMTMRIKMGINVYGTFNFHFQRCLQALGIYKMIEIPSQPLNCHRHFCKLPCWTVSDKCSKLLGYDRSPTHKRKENSLGVNSTLSVKQQASRYCYCSGV